MILSCFRQVVRSFVSGYELLLCLFFFVLLVLAILGFQQIWIQIFFFFNYFIICFISFLRSYWWTSTMALPHNSLIFISHKKIFFFLIVFSPHTYLHLQDSSSKISLVSIHFCGYACPQSCSLPRWTFSWRLSWTVSCEGLCWFRIFSSESRMSILPEGAVDNSPMLLAVAWKLHSNDPVTRAYR